jgi:cytochrome c
MTPRSPMRWLLAAVLLGLLSGCERDHGSPQLLVGDSARGKRLMREYGCHTCHVIPGVDGANSVVGPPLGGIAERVYAGGRLNTPPNLVAFIRDPQAVDARTPMPNVGANEPDARDMAAYLYTLRD